MSSSHRLKHCGCLINNNLPAVITELFAIVRIYRLLILSVYCSSIFISDSGDFEKI